MEEAWMEDQLIQSRWDAFLRKRPVCCLCGEPILSTHGLEMENQWYCGDCVRRHTREVGEAVAPASMAFQFFSTTSMPFLA